MTAVVSVAMMRRKVNILSLLSVMGPSLLMGWQFLQSTSAHGGVRHHAAWTGCPGEDRGGPLGRSGAQVSEVSLSQGGATPPAPLRVIPQNSLSPGRPVLCKPWQPGWYGL